jgi:hypothetical protein
MSVIDPARLCLKSVRIEPVERRGVFDKALLSLSSGSARTELILHRAGSIVIRKPSQTIA